ncbi:beta-1,4-mannosyltransferase egh isoform X2 [Ptiloglossa arizonensis]|uniref:beta-1,4-mannosyltransferase egh isoform X2 n=1 Tax=Ptiloglossa arizonensis TaxID=3350558 RepID=UPI003F9F238A
MLNSVTKHILHCCLLFIVIIVFELVFGGLSWNSDNKGQLDPWVQYGFVGALTLYVLRTLTFLSFPQVLFNFIGLTIYNAFPDKVILKGSPLLAPFICIRIVTRGDYPHLVKENVNRNLNKCVETGLENFQIEVVSDKPIGLAFHRRVREVVVPLNYHTSSGALFKARALQYCLESSVNELADNDWIVHLDEETLLTKNSVRGILNFVLDGKHQFGQGLITYANEDVVNWLTTLADSFRVADDMGKLRLQFTMFHKPFFSMKGSYVVTQMGAEKQVSFNNGLDGSVAEDCFFAMKAFTQGYTFNFVDGEMWEKSPFTLWDFVQQRKRWLQGISCYSWVTLPLSTSNVILAGLYPIICPPFIDFLCAFICAVNIYMYIFGVVKSFSLYRFGIARFILCICGALSTIPFNLIIENVAVIWGIFGKKHTFYVVNKQYKSYEP